MQSVSVYYVRSAIVVRESNNENGLKNLMNAAAKVKKTAEISQAHPRRRGKRNSQAVQIDATREMQLDPQVLNRSAVESNN